MNTRFYDMEARLDDAGIPRVKGTRRVDVVYEGEIRRGLPLLAVEFGDGMDFIFVLVIWDKTMFLNLVHIWWLVF